MKINLKPNEQVINASDAKLFVDDRKVPVKVVYTTQNRLYIITDMDNMLEFDKNNIIEIVFFNRNFFFNDGVNIVCKNKNVKFLIKKRRNWEILLGKLY